MKKIKIISVFLVFIIASVLMISATCPAEKEVTPVKSIKQMVNLFVTHGHCSTPFAGEVENLILKQSISEGQGNPLENMSISFEIKPQTFRVCTANGLTEKIHLPGLFYENIEETIAFRSTDVYTMGLDWYQINGKLTIKGIEKDVKLFASGIRNPNVNVTSHLILESQFNLLDWGIDYDKIMNGKSDPVPTKWMHLNMKIDLTDC